MCTCDGAYVHVYFADTHIRMWDYRAIYYELEHCHPHTIHVLTYLPTTHTLKESSPSCPSKSYTAVTKLPSGREGKFPFPVNVSV